MSAKKSRSSVSVFSCWAWDLDRLSRAQCQKYTGAALSTVYLSASSSCFCSLWRLRRTLVSVWRVGAVAGSITLVHFSTAVYLIFRFLAGCSGAAFLSIAGGSVSDMFSISEVATYVVRCYLGSLACLMILNSPMAVYTICPFLGPEIGPVLSG